MWQEDQSENASHKHRVQHLEWRDVVVTATTSHQTLLYLVSRKQNNRQRNTFQGDGVTQKGFVGVAAIAVFKNFVCCLCSSISASVVVCHCSVVVVFCRLCFEAKETVESPSSTTLGIRPVRLWPFHFLSRSMAPLYGLSHELQRTVSFRQPTWWERCWNQIHRLALFSVSLVAAACTR